MKDVEFKGILRIETTKNKEFRQIINAESGQVIDQYWQERKEKPSGKPPAGRRPHFLKVYRSNLIDIVQKKNLTIDEAGLLLMLLSYIDWQSPYIVHPKTGANMNESEIAELMPVSKPVLIKNIQSLCNKGMLARVCKGIGKEHHFMLNSNLFFYGNSIKDKNDHAVFSKDCAYKPQVEIKYREVEKK